MWLAQNPRTRLPGSAFLAIFRVAGDFEVEGEKVTQFLEDYKYIAVVVDGEVERYKI